MPKYQIKVSALNDRMETIGTVECNDFLSAIDEAHSLCREFSADANPRIQSITNLDYREHEGDGDGQYCNGCGKWCASHECEDNGFGDVHSYV